MAAPQPNITDGINVLKRTDVIFALGLVSILVLLLLPMPKFLLDVFLAFSITFSVLIFMTTIFIEKPLQFNSFPTILLVATMLRLSLNVASTRLILSNGHEGIDAAGDVIKAFGGFLMGGSFVIGIIIFIILVIVNFIVITKGSGRIAEVSARFSLDSMPGKQMAIDADLSSGLIDENTARTRRKEIEMESNFFGSMDGAAKFVRGDAVAGILITAINIVAGIIIGVSNGLNFSQAAHTYTLLTIGDGLVSQVPALMVSVAAGMLVTKGGTEGSADKALLSQLAAHPVALGLCSFLMIAIGFLPGVPKIPFFILAFLTGAGAWYITMQVEDDKEVDEEEAPSSEPELSDEEKLQSALRIDPMRLELGYALLPLANAKDGNGLADQIRTLRQQVAAEMGVILPAVRIQDNLQLDSKEYNILLKDVEVGASQIEPNFLLVMNPGGDAINIDGMETKDPAFGIPAKWIDKNLKKDAEEEGLTIVDAQTVLITHFSEIVKENLPDLLSYEDTQKLITELEKDHKTLVNDLIPDPISISIIHRILQNLLRERVSIRDLPSILAALSEIAGRTGNVTQMTEHVRSKIGRQISSDHLNQQGVLPVIHMGPRWQQKFHESLVKEGDTLQMALSPTDLQTFIEFVRETFDNASYAEGNPVLLTSGNIRPFVRSIIERFRSSIPVLSQNEIHPKIRIKTIGEIREPDM